MDIEATSPGRGFHPRWSRLEASHDRHDGIVVVEGGGLWTKEAVDEHFDGMQRSFASARARNERVRVLVDLSTADVQVGAVSLRVKERAGRLYQPGDKVALVTQSSLLSMQMRRVSGRARYRQFTDRDAALQWLDQED